MQHAKLHKSTQYHAHCPPAKIATPKFGSDVAAMDPRATLRAAVLQAPEVALNMSTALEKLLPLTAQGMRTANAICKATRAHSRSESKMTTTQHTKIVENNIASTHVLQPPAKIASPIFGSSVAAILYRATLRAAVLQAPEVTLKMSTASVGSEKPFAAAKYMRLALKICKSPPAILHKKHGM
jgi:hypothetical protein